MTKEELFEQLEEEVEIIHSDKFDLIVTESNSVPTHSHSNLTFTNFDDKLKRVKKIKPLYFLLTLENHQK